MEEMDWFESEAIVGLNDKSVNKKIEISLTILL